MSRRAINALIGAALFVFLVWLGLWCSWIILGPSLP